MLFIAFCRAAWDVFFPAKQVLTPAGAMRSRLKMILYSDRYASYQCFWLQLARLELQLLAELTSFLPRDTGQQDPRCCQNGQNEKTPEHLTLLT